MKYIVEHMEEDLFEWCQLEYNHMASVVGKDCLLFTNLPASQQAKMPESVLPANCFPKSVADLNLPIHRICLLDQEATEVLSPADSEQFDYVLFGGILGDEDTEAMECLVRDRTCTLRDLGFPTRHLGSAQMTTDGAVLTSKLILQDKIPFSELKFVDHPEIPIGKRETTVMPFRYIEGKNGEPVMAPGMVELLKNDTLNF